MTPAISLEDTWLRRGTADVLAGFSLRLAAGETVALLGPSGSGKTTALRIALGLLAPDRGFVRIGDEIVSEGRRVLVPPERRGLAVVFQDLALWPHFTVAQNLAFGLDTRKTPRSARDSRILAMLERVGLANEASRYPGELSGGERQRVAIARALVVEPRAVLLDEPLANVDVVLRSELLALFRSLFMERLTTAVYVTHEIRDAIALGVRIAVLEQGRVIAQGTAEELADAPPTRFVRALFAEMALTGPGRVGSGGELAGAQRPIENRVCGPEDAEVQQ
jgi:iron(III) transport system ATP-binding protein